MSELTQMLHRIALAYFESRAKELAALVPPNLLNITRKLLNHIFCCATVEGLLCEVDPPLLLALSRVFCSQCSGYGVFPRSLVFLKNWT